MIKINPSTISGQISAPGSKSHAQRLLFMASMPTRPTRVKNVPRCNDIDTTIGCLEALGCKISPDGDDYIVSPFAKTSPLPTADFNFKESSTTAHLAVALCSAIGMKAQCTASSNLIRRKMVQMTGRLALRGITFSSFSLPFTLTGRLSGGEFAFPGDEGSQAISAVMMFASCALYDSTITYTSPLADDSFIKLTQKSMEKFGVHIEETENGFNIEGRQFFQSPKEISTEKDWGLATMWALAGAASGKNGKGVTVTGLDPNSVQKYRNLNQLCNLIYQNFEYINFNASECPNLATLLCALAIVKGASFKVTNVPQLKHKETNRLAICAEIARMFGQDAKLSEDGIEIIGNGNPITPQGPIDTEGDPWVFMSMVLASAKAKEPFILADEHGADKIYRDFLDDFKSLGGQFEII